MSFTIFALQGTQLGLGILIAAVLAGALLVPYLFKEIRRGKGELGRQVKETRRGTVELGPITPTGAGDNHPGRKGNPAPGQPDGQADPYGRAAQRSAPEVQS